MAIDRISSTEAPRNWPDRWDTLAGQIEQEIDSATSIGTTALTSDTVSALSTYEQWGTETVNLGNPGRDVLVLAWTGGYALDNTAPAIVSSRTQISLDGAATWVNGDALAADVNGTDVARAVQFSQAQALGTPTGDVLVRAQIRQTNGTAGDATWFGGQIMVVMH